MRHAPTPVTAERGSQPHGRQDTREATFWMHFAATVLLTTLIMITAAIGDRLADSTAERLLAAGAVLAVAGLALAASRAATRSIRRPRDTDRRR